MVGIPVDSLWLVSLDLSMGEKKKIKKQEKSRPHKRKANERIERVSYRPSHSWMDLP